MERTVLWARGSHNREISLKNKLIIINLNEGLNVILGENNVGKTNFVTALRIALNYFFDPIEPINLSKRRYLYK